jgi:uncharacterized protein (TIGR01244 family)
MNRFALFVLSIFLPLSACAGDVEVAPASPLKVDLSNIVETGFVQPVDGITPAGQPDKAAFEVFAANGYKAVVDLRTADEARGLDEQAVVEGLGMEYVLFPIDSDGINFKNARALDEIIGSYDAPVLVHCASSNRVGALLALRASLDGADDDASIEVGKRGGLTRLEGEVREVLSQK